MLLRTKLIELRKNPQAAANVAEAFARSMPQSSYAPQLLDRASKLLVDSDAVKSKPDIMKYLKDSFVYIHKAAGTINDKNLVSPIKNPFGEGTATRLGLALGVAGHCSNHYGQMVEYLRMNGIIPPASRQ